MVATSPLQLDPHRTEKPLPLIQPTLARFQHIDLKDGTAADESDSHNHDNLSDARTRYQPASSVEFKWTSRNNRKGRHAIVVDPTDAASAAYNVPPFSDTAGEILKTIWSMATYYPVWDISWLVAYIFTLGSVVWVFNAFFVFYPDLRPSQDYDNLIYYGGGITAFIGATIFEIGSVFLLLEAFNADQGGCFGWALEKMLERNEKGVNIVKAVPNKEMCHHHHFNKKNLVGKAAKDTHDQWTWWPSGDEFRRHYFHDLGFIASAAQMTGATIFWISGFTALPGIYDNLSPGALIGTYWVPQVVGGSFFILSGSLFMLETQKSWWQPAFRTLGWHIGMWNTIGGLGFTLCPAFGLCPDEWAQYQASCSTFWGSWAFLIASVIQWYESLNKHPVERA